MPANVTFDYFFDPLCGWCYASAPALNALARACGDRLTLHPSGLFVPPRPVASIAEHAWTNDQRIAALTGQVFSETYHRDVLLAPEGVFSSLALTRMLVALGTTDPVIEPAFLHAAQIARYVEGRDTAQADVVVAIAARTAQDLGHDIGAAELRARLEDADLHRRTDKRIARARRLMEGLGITGVPQLVVQLSAGAKLIDSRMLYSDGAAVLSRLAAVIPAAGFGPPPPLA